MRASTFPRRAMPRASAAKTATTRVWQRLALVSGGFFFFLLQFWEFISVLFHFLFNPPTLTFSLNPPLPAITCPAITLGNGTTNGSCNGNYNDTCIYASCNVGYKFDVGGNSVRQCKYDGQYSGTPMTCIRKCLFFYTFSHITHETIC